MDNVAHILCCQIRADDISSTCTFTTGKSLSQSHASAHVLMRLYPIDKSLVCSQSKRRTGRHVRIIFIYYVPAVRCQGALNFIHVCTLCTSHILFQLLDVGGIKLYPCPYIMYFPHFVSPVSCQGALNFIQRLYIMYFPHYVPAVRCQGALNFIHVRTLCTYHILFQLLDVRGHYKLSTCRPVGIEIVPP